MMFRHARWIRLGFAAAIGLGGLLAGLVEIRAADPLQPDHARRTVTGSAFVHGHLQIATGNEAEARAYYRTVVAPQMNFENPETIEATTIKNLLTYFGYSNVNARDLHGLSSDALMALGSGTDIVATFFFAPKISKVSTPAPAIPDAFGWRKLVRFKAKPGSGADTNGMDSLHFLQNIFEKSAAATPAPDKNVSLFNQAIVIRKSGSGPYSAAKRALYFFAYDPLVKCDNGSGGAKDCEGSDVPLRIDGQFQDSGTLGFKLKATFDARDPETEAPGQDFFYVPRSCQDCHGKSISNGKLNFLDTDHWFDRVKPDYGLADARFSQEDFTALTQAILPDGGADTTTPQFKKAFDVLRLLNTEIKAQNQDAATVSDINAPANFQIRAVSKWLELHDPGRPDATRHVPPYQRGFGISPWDPASNQDRTLVYYLNRYCYRCHSSIRYSVFERSAVLNIRGDIMDRVVELNDLKIWMPQDRIFPGLEQTNGVAAPTGDLKQFLDLLQALQ